MLLSPARPSLSGQAQWVLYPQRFARRALRYRWSSAHSRHHPLLGRLHPARRGAALMMTSEEERWLLSTFPGLVSRDGVVAETISFTVTYNPDTRQFLRLEHDVVDDIGGVRLFCTHGINLQQSSKNLHALPALL